MKRKKIGFSDFDFVSVGLVAASGLLSIDAYSAYLDAMRPKPPQKRKRKDGGR